MFPEVLGSLMHITCMAKPRARGWATHFLEKHLGRELGEWLEASA